MLQLAGRTIQIKHDERHSSGTRMFASIVLRMEAKGSQCSPQLSAAGANVLGVPAVLGKPGAVARRVDLLRPSLL